MDCHFNRPVIDDYDAISSRNNLQVVAYLGTVRKLRNWQIPCGRRSLGSYSECIGGCTKKASGKF